MIAAHGQYVGAQITHTTLHASSAAATDLVLCVSSSIWQSAITLHSTTVLADQQMNATLLLTSPRLITGTCCACRSVVHGVSPPVEELRALERALQVPWSSA